MVGEEQTMCYCAKKRATHRNLGCVKINDNFLINSVVNLTEMGFQRDSREIEMSGSDLLCKTPS